MADRLHLRLASLEDDDPWIVEQQYFTIVDNYLQPDSTITAHDAALQMNELTPMSREARGEESETPDSWCLEVWGTFSEIVKQIPHDHPSQDKMIDFIKALKDLPGVEVPTSETSTARIWTDLPYLKEVWHDCYMFPRPENTSSELETCVNWHAFSARALQEGLADWFLLTTWCFSDALEKPHEVDDSWICQIQTAVQWIQYSRDALFHALDNLPDLECLMPGPLYTGKDGFSRERWGFWESRFRELAVDERLSKEIMSMCHEAAKQMAETSGINGVGEQGVEEPTQPENQ